MVQYVNYNTASYAYALALYALLRVATLPTFGSHFSESYFLTQRVALCHSFLGEFFHEGASACRARKSDALQVDSMGSWTPPCVFWQCTVLVLHLRCSLEELGTEFHMQL